MGDQKRAAQPVLKLLRSAIANAVNNNNSVKENLYIKKITVDQGPTLKRWRARARGRAFPIHKKTSHIIVELDAGEVETTKAAQQVADVIEAPKTEETPEQENLRLKKENEELKKVNYILKKAAAFFSQDHLK